jgi:hypothetical protein
MPYQTEELLKPETLRETVQHYEAAIAKVVRGYDLLDEAQQDLQQTFGEKSYMRTLPPACYSAKSKVLEMLNRKAWRSMIIQSRIIRIISNKRKNDIFERIENKDMPPFTYEQVWNTVSMLMENVNELAWELIDETFDFLRPPGSEYKTNSRWHVPYKVILSGGVVYRYSDRTQWRVSHYYYQKLTVLSRTFHFLDGELLEYRDGAYVSPLVDSISSSIDASGQTKYISWKAFKNGNLHLKFLRKDLVDKLNLAGAAGRNALPENFF